MFYSMIVQFLFISFLLQAAKSDENTSRRVCSCNPQLFCSGNGGGRQQASTSDVINYLDKMTNFIHRMSELERKNDDFRSELDELKSRDNETEKYNTRNNWEIRRCDLDTHVTSATAIELDGTFSTSSAAEACQAISSKVVNDANYEISVDTKNKQGWKGINSGHPGIIFNAQNSKNYDMIYLRPHQTSTCQQTGYLANGKWNGLVSKACPNGPPRGGVWFNIKVKMMNNRATVYRDGVQITSYVPHFASRGQGGVFLWLGYNNIVEYKNFTVTAL